jgi:hypothetical protein
VIFLANFGDILALVVIAEIVSNKTKTSRVLEMSLSRFFRSSFWFRKEISLLKMLLVSIVAGKELNGF